MSRRYFGTDGVRGRVGETPITPDFALRLGYAAGMTLVKRESLASGERPAVLIGKDTRSSGYMLEAALESGLSAAGVDVWLAGPMPTPAVAYLTRALRLQAGIVISASHNPFHDNGIKFFSANGMKLPDAVEKEIEDQMDEPLVCVAADRLGRARRVDDAAGRYIEFCKSTFPTDLDLRGMKIVVDSAHGAAYHIAPKVFHELGAEVISVGAEPNGLNINDQVGATSPQSLARAVPLHGADIGLALDGDGDRLIMADSEGMLYDGDRLLYVIARHRLMADGVNGTNGANGVGGIGGMAGTLMTNLGMEHAVARLGLPFARAKVGDRYVLELMQSRGWKLGGENSGHIICLDRHSTGDGIVSALQVLAALRLKKETLAQACADLSMYPQVLLNVRVPAGYNWQADSALVAGVSAAEQALNGQGRVLLRPSGTEPLLRIMVEGPDGPKVEALAASLAQTAQKSCPVTPL